ncbi:unnamed protein product [Nezara viridula]|uniref:Probable prefoldin subunit 6 n=1 Tax=Nezara viridula TaxID=85310 RepID=A0A9P0ME52_NEZVI|nr:unnamed protein product [Nezara viridula]
MDELQAKLQAELDKFKAVEKEYHKAVSQRQVLDGQLHENTGVKQELDLLKDDGEVYKLIGPVLVKQDLTEAKQNVAKRMDYIKGEFLRYKGTQEKKRKNNYKMVRQDSSKSRRLFVYGGCL